MHRIADQLQALAKTREPREGVYLDCAATTPMDPRAQAEVVRFLEVEFGNAGSRTHEFGVRARRAVENARSQVAAVVAATRGEVVFTSGATESNNLAILGLADYGIKARKTHLVSTQIEHHAVLEPLRALECRGFEVTLVRPNRDGWVDPQALYAAVRENTLLVSVMQVNNETGVRQPLEQICELLRDHSAYFHVDAAQGYGRELGPLRNSRIDLISVSGHKVHGPKGIGALVMRRRQGQRPPLSPLMYGGGQELGLRPGTLPVHLIVGLGMASELAVAEAQQRSEADRQFRQKLLGALRPLNPVLVGDQDRVVPHIINLYFPGISGEEVMEELAGIIAISNGAACTTQSQSCSHVLSAMSLWNEAVDGALRISWCYLTPEVDWGRVVEVIREIGARRNTPMRFSRGSIESSPNGPPP